MSFPLINPFQQFFDSSGSPLVSGTIEFRNPNTNDLINSYPTADDADAQTNANANPLTLDANGAASSGLYLEDGVKYKIILKNSAGATVTTQDDVRCPLYRVNDVGKVLYPEVTAETSASATISAYQYPPGDIRRYGAATGTADNTTAIQDAINSAAHGGFKVFIPGDSGARYRFASTIYGFYDAANNPNFPSGASSDGRLVIEGEGAPNKDNFTSNTYRGSVLEYTAATGVGIDLYDDSGTEAKAVVLRDFGLYANTSGYPLQMDRIPQLSILENVFVGNDGNGGGIKIDTWAASLSNVWVYGNGSGSAIAFDTSDGGGNVVWKNVNAENCDVGFDFGAAYDATRAAVDFIWNHMLIACQAKTNRVGYRIRAGVGALTMWDCWAEGNTERSLTISDMAGWADNADIVLGDYANQGIIKIIGGYFAETATTGFMAIEIGDDTATETTDGAGNILIDGLIIGQISAGAIGIRIHNSTNAGYRHIRNLVVHNNGGILCAIDDEAQYGTIFAENWSTDTYNENNRIEEISGWPAGAANERSYWAVTDWEPVLGGTGTFSFANAKRMPSISLQQSGGTLTLTLPTSPEEHSAIITLATENANDVVLDPGANNLNGATTDLTFSGKNCKLLLSYEVNAGWTVGVAPTPGTNSYSPTNVSTDRAFDANAGAGAISASPTQGEVENIRDALLELADVVGTLVEDLKTSGLIT